MGKRARRRSKGEAEERNTFQDRRTRKESQSKTATKDSSKEQDNRTTGQQDNKDKSDTEDANRTVNTQGEERRKTHTQRRGRGREGNEKDGVEETFDCVSAVAATGRGSHATWDLKETRCIARGDCGSGCRDA